MEKATRDTTEDGRRESVDAYERAERAAKDSAVASVTAATRGLDIPDGRLDEYKGAASTQTATAHSIGRDYIASSSPKGG